MSYPLVMGDVSVPEKYVNYSLVSMDCAVLVNQRFGHRNLRYCHTRSNQGKYPIMGYPLKILSVL